MLFSYHLGTYGIFLYKVPMYLKLILCSIIKIKLNTINFVSRFKNVDNNVLITLYIPTSKKSTMDSNGKRGFIKFIIRDSQNYNLYLVI